MAFRRPQIMTASLVATLATVLACSKAPDRISTGGGGADVGRVPPGVKPDPFVEPEKLKLGSIAADDASMKSFDFVKTSEIAWESASSFVMAHGDGKSISYDFKKAAWSSVHSNATITDYVTLFDFRDAGFFGTTADVLSFRKGDGQIVRLNSPAPYKTGTLVGANPGFVGFSDKGEISAITTTEEAATLYPLPGAPEGLKLIYPCNKHCLVWGFDGSKIYIYFTQTGWKLLDQVIELPAGEKISRMAVRFRDTNNPVAAESILVQSEGGKLFAQVAGTVTKADPTWEDIKTISDRFCVQCHLDDGFEKETTWKSLKSVIVTRLKAAPGTKGAMPPTETNIGKEMAQGERNLILAWIEKQEQIERGEVGMPTDGVVDNSDVSGELKTLADKYCIGCHADFKKNATWKLKKGPSISQIEAGTMPKAMAISAADKKKLLELINAIK